MPIVNVRANKQQISNNVAQTSSSNTKTSHTRAGITFDLRRPSITQNNGADAAAWATTPWTPWQEGVTVSDEQLAQLQGDPVIEVVVVE